VAWQYVSLLAQGALQLAALATLSRLLVPAHFGSFALGMLTVELAAVANMSLGYALVQREHLTARHTATAFTLSLVAGVLLCPVLWLAAPVVALVCDDPVATTAVRGLSLLPLLMYGAVACEAGFLRELKFKSLMGAEVVGYGLGFLPCAVILAASGAGVWALVVGTLVQHAVRSAAMLVARRRTLALGIWWPELRDLWAFAGPFSVARVFNVVAHRADHVVAARALSSGLLGTYNRSLRLVQLPTKLLGGVLQRVGFAALSQAQGAPERLARGYIRLTFATTLAAVPCSCVLVVTAPDLVAAILGPQWDRVVLPLQVLAAALWMRNVSKISDAVATAAGALAPRARSQAAYAAAAVAGSVVGSRWGIAGVAAGMNVAVALNYVLMSRVCLRATRTVQRRFVIAHLPGVSVGAVCAALAYAATRAMAASGQPAAIRLGSAWAAAAVPFGVVFCMPRMVGQNGVWLRALIAGSVPRKGLRRT
jgi:O-antigen/teichoic acid export membrane protein